MDRKLGGCCDPLLVGAGTEVDLGIGDIVLDGDPAPPPKKKEGAQHPFNVGQCIAAKRLDGSWCHLVWGRLRPRPHCVRLRPSPFPSPRKTAEPPFSAMSVVAKRSPISTTVLLLSTCLNCPVLTTGWFGSGKSYV